jgi:hypothetical protein
MCNFTGADVVMDFTGCEVVPCSLAAWSPARCSVWNTACLIRLSAQVRTKKRSKIRKTAEREPALHAAVDKALTKKLYRLFASPTAHPSAFFSASNPAPHGQENNVELRPDEKERKEEKKSLGTHVCILAQQPKVSCIVWSTAVHWAPVGSPGC